MTAPAVQPLPRERAPGQYEVQNEQRYRQQVDEELQQKHDRRSHLRLGRGKFLILSAPEGLEYQIGLTNGGLLTVTNNTTGAAGEFVVDWDTINGAAARDAQILALESSVDGIPGIYATISALASVESTLEGSIATLETNLTAAFQAGDATLQTDINTRATNTRVDTVESNAASALASTSTSLTAAYQAADATLQSDINTRATSAALTTESIARAAADSALSSSITSLTATVGGNTSSITTNATAISTLNSSSAIYEVIAAASGGNPARIKLKAGVGGADVELDADRVWFGDETRFDTTSETFITEVGGVRSRYGTAFGASGNEVVMWHGPTSVAVGSEARNNGYLAIGTNGSIWYNTGALDWGATAAEAAASNAKVAVAGTNRVRYSEMQFGTTGYKVVFDPSGIISGSLATSEFNGYRYIFANWTATALNDPLLIGTDDALANTQIRVVPGERLSVQAVIEASASSGAAVNFTQLRIQFFSASGASISEVVADEVTGNCYLPTLLAGFVTVPATSVYARVYVSMFAGGASSGLLVMSRPSVTGADPLQTEHPAYAPGLNAEDGADPTIDNTAAAITGQGVWATGNYYEQTSDPGSVPNGSFWFKTDTNEFYVRRSGAWGKVATIANQNITISRTNGFVKTRIGAGTIISDAVSFSSTGGSGTGYTYAHELFPTYTTGPSPSISSASGSPITASAAGAVPGDEVRGFVQTTVTDSAGNKTTLTSPVALFCES